MRKLADLFYQSAQNFPNKLAIWCDGKTMTYHEMAELVSKYSNFLMNQGVSYQENIGIPMTNSIESVALIFAAANIGVGLVPINPTLPVPAVKKAFQRGKVKHVIARKAFFYDCDKEGKLEVEGIKICMDDELEDTISFDKINECSTIRPECAMITGDETLILTMTSGSTGAPKPIELTQNNKYDRAIEHIDLYKITSEDRILAATPLYHSLAERLVIMPFIIGATSVLLPRFTPSIWLNCVAELKVTFTIAVSAQLSQVMELVSSPLAPKIDQLRAVVSSSALLETHVKNALIEKLNCDFHEMYGTSEVSTVTNINFKESLTKQKSVGKALDVADIHILREDLTIAEPGEIGEIAVKTKLRCKSYYGMDEEMKKSIVDDYFCTGDLGYLDKEGYLYFYGRKKELIITGGINVYPKDIEECVTGLEEVLECAAFAYPDERLGEVVALAVVPHEGVDLKQRLVRLHCAHYLADFQQPHKIFIVQQLPKNAMGKLLKGKLLEYVGKEN